MELQTPDSKISMEELMLGLGPFSDQSDPMASLGGLEGVSMDSLMEAFAKSQQQSQEEQKAGLGEQQQMLKKYLEAQVKPDLSPFLSYVDATTGSNFSKSYDKPLSEQERQKVAISLQNDLNERMGGITKTQSDTLKSLIAAKMGQDKLAAQGEYFGKMMDERKRSRLLREDTLVNKVNDIWDKDKIAVETERSINNLMRDYHTLSGAAVIDKATATELARGIGSALSGSKAAGWHEVQSMIPQSMEAKLNEVASWVKGDKRQAITPDQRAYLLDMLARIEEGFKISKKRRAETVFNRKMSTPNLQRAVDAKKQSVLDEVGPVNDHPDGPTGGMTPKLSAKDQQAVDWAKKNPNDLDAIAILKRLGVQ